MAHKINQHLGRSICPSPGNKGTSDMPDTSSRLLDLSISEKVAKLSAFIASDIDTRAARGLYAAGGCYLLIARSPESPVAVALRDHTAGLAKSGIRIRAVFGDVELGQGAAMVAAAPFALPSECRIARDPRLLAAHEQLVLSPDCAWIGDSMRREPSKRDAYESYAAGCAETATNAARSFEKIWRAAAPVRSIPVLPAALASRLPDIPGVGLERPETPRRQ
jgi:hypothetical protein